jgi:acyl dehydratase
MTPQYWEDVEIGARRELGAYTFTQAEIIAFARKYDPQPFHIDPEAAKHSMFGGIVASGWHTAAIWMKLAIEGRNSDAASGKAGPLRSGVSPGFEDMKWLRPVRPGMTLTYVSQIVGKVELRSRPELGLIKSLNEARDETGALVMSFTGKGFVQRRPAA